MSTRTKLIGAALAVAVIPSILNAQTPFTGTYGFDDVVANAGNATDPTPPPQSDGLHYGSFTANGLGATPRSSGIWNFSGWTTGTEPDVGKYFETTLSPLNGRSLDLDSLSFSVRRSASGPHEFAVRSSLDGFSGNLAGTLTPSNVELSYQSGSFHFVNDIASTANQAGPTIQFGTDFDRLNQPVTLRIYGFGAESGSGTFGVDDVALNGSMSAVPEPEEYAAMAAGSLVVFAAWRRRTQMKSARKP